MEERMLKTKRSAKTHHPPLCKWSRIVYFWRVCLPWSATKPVCDAGWSLGCDRYEVSVIHQSRSAATPLGTNGAFKSTPFVACCFVADNIGC
jgi:hypothetical protein